MADKRINIRLNASANLAAFRDANTALVQMARSAGTTNKAMAAAASRANAAFTEVGNVANKVSSVHVRSAKEIEEAWRQAYKQIGDQTATATARLAEFRAKVAEIRAQTEKNDAAKQMRAVGEAARGSESGVSGLSKSIGILTQGAGNLGKMLSAAFGGGLFAAAAFGIRAVVSLFTSAYQKMKEEIEDHKKAQLDSMDALIGKVKEYNSAIQESANAVRESIDASLAKRKSEIDLTERLTKAEIELAKQRMIASGANEDFVNAAAEVEENAATAQAARKRSDADIFAAGSRLDAAIQERDAAWDEVANLRRIKANLGPAYELNALDDEAMKKGYEFRRELDRKIESARAAAFGADDRVKMEEEALAAAKRGREALETELESSELKISNEIEKKELESSKKVTEERIKAEQEIKKAEVKAAKDAAAEREKIDREIHQKRMADLRAEIELQKKEAEPLKATISAAQSEFDKAFAMYRDPERAAAQIAEERDYAADLKQLRKDASRYSGKWRIDELSQLMAAGDTQGVQTRLEEWRKSRRFTPEVEAMVRASAADQTKTTAEDELRRLNEKTGKLTEDLERLSQSRDGKLSAIEKNTNQLAEKIDALLSVKG